MAYAIANGMKLKIDKAGRIVLPKPVRERFHLREGSELELEERSDGLTLRPVEQRSSMVRKNGIWVHLGKVPRGFDWDTTVDAIREERRGPFGAHRSGSEGNQCFALPRRSAEGARAHPCLPSDPVLVAEEEGFYFP